MVSSYRWKKWMSEKAPNERGWAELVLWDAAMPQRVEIVDLGAVPDRNLWGFTVLASGMLGWELLGRREDWRDPLPSIDSEEEWAFEVVTPEQVPVLGQTYVIQEYWPGEPTREFRAMASSVSVEDPAPFGPYPVVHVTFAPALT